MLAVKTKRITANMLLWVMLMNPALVAANGVITASDAEPEFTLPRHNVATGVIVDTSSGDTQRTGVKESANGTTVIDIAEASQAGVSHNLFSQFNVDENGLILNNSLDPIISQLGGWTDGNRRLAGGTASIILAEVTGSNASSLLGFTEILGDSAEFVLANSNGITCSGCGFINTPRVTFATGAPDVQNGELLGFNIHSGSVVIDGEGLNASNVSKFDILTRAMFVNAALYANELSLYTGSNYVGYSAGDVQVLENQPGDTPFRFALDASALGSMYVNRIKLIGTEAGVGVRSDGLISATDSVELTADGRIRLKDTQTAGELTLNSTANDIILDGTTFGNNVSIEAGGSIGNGGVLSAQNQLNVIAQASIENQGTVVTEGDMSLAGANLTNQTDAIVQSGQLTVQIDDIVNTGTLIAQNLVIEGSQLTNAGHIQGDNLSITANIGQTDGTLYQSSDEGLLTINADQTVVTGGLIAHDGSATITSGNIVNNSNWLANGAATINAQSVVNTGTLQAESALTLNADTLINSGTLLFNNETDLGITLNQSLNNDDGVLQSAAGFNISTQQISNQNGQILLLNETDSSNLRATAEMDNSAGQILSNGTVQLTAGELSNTEGVINGAGLTIEADTLLNQSGSITAQTVNIAAQTLNNQQGTLAAEQLNLAGEQLNNEQGVIVAQRFAESEEQTAENTPEQDLALNLNFGSEINNSNGGIIESQSQDASFITTHLNNSGGQISLAGTGVLSVNAQTLLNEAGTLIANNAALNIDTINNDAGNLLAQTQLTMSGSDISSHEGVIQAGEQLNIQLSGTLSASGTPADQAEGEATEEPQAIISAQQVAISSGQINLGEAAMINAESLSVNAQQVTNQGLIRAFGESQNALTLTTEHLVNRGRVESLGENLLLNNMLINNNQGEIVHLGLGVLQLQFLDDLNNQNGLIYSESGLAASALENGDFLNNNGQLFGATDVTLTAGNIQNTGGVLQAQSQLTINASQLNNGKDGQISANNALVSVLSWGNNGIFAANHANVSASRIDNSGTIQVMSVPDTEQPNSGSGTMFTFDTRTLINQGVLLTDAANLVLNQVQLNNENGIIAHQGAGVLEINATGALNNNQGVINGNDLNISAASLSNTDGQIAALFAQANMQVNVVGELSNHNGEIGSAGDLAVTALRLLNNEGVIQATSNSTIAADTLENLGEGLIFADDTLNIATDVLTNQGTLQANQLLTTASAINVGAIHNTGTIAATGTQGDTLVLDTRNLTNSGVIVSRGENLTLDNVALNNTEGVITLEGLGVLNIEAPGSLNNTEGQIASSGGLILDTDTLINDQGIVVANDNAQLNLTELSNAGGILSFQNAAAFNLATLNNNNGQIVASSLDIRATALNNREGAMVATGTDADSGLTLTVAGEVDNTQGQIVSAGEQASITATTVQNTQGLIQSEKALSLAATQLNNTGLIQGGDVDVTVTRFDNRGDLIANAHLNLTQANLINTGNVTAISSDISAESIDNAGVINITGEQDARFLLNVQTLNNTGAIASQTAHMNVRSGTLNNSNGQLLHFGLGVFSLAALDTLTNQAGTLVSEGQLHLTTATLNNHNGQILVGSSDNNPAGSGVLRLNANNITHTGTGAIASSGSLEIDANNLVSNALISAQGTTGLTIDRLTLQTDSQLLTGDLSIQSAHFDNGGVVSSQHTSINADNITNAGLLAVAGDLQLNAVELLNTQGQIQVTNHLNVDVATFNNTEGALLSNGTATLNADTLVNQQGQLGAQQLTLNIADIDNTHAGQIFGEQSLTIDTTTLVSNGEISGGQLLLQAQSAEQQTSAILTANQLTITADTLQNAGQLNAVTGQLTLGSLDNTGTVQAQDSLTVNTDALTNSGNLLSDGVLAVGANTGSLSLENAGTIGAGQLNINVEQLNNQADAVLAAYDTTGNVMQLNVAQTLNNAGRIYNGGEAGEINAGIISNSGQVEHAGTGMFSLNAQRIENLAQGAMGTNGELAFTTPDMLNTGTLSGHGLTINAQNTLNQGSIVSDELTVNATNLNNTGSIQSLVATLNAQTIDNAGQILGAGTESGVEALNINATQLTNTGSLISRSDNFTLNDININNQNGQILHFGVGVLDIDTLDALQNQSGLMYSDGTADLTALSLENQQGRILTQHMVIQTDELNNQSGVLQGLQSFNIQADSLHNNAGLITLDAPDPADAVASANTRTASITVAQTLNNLNGVLRFEGDGQMSLSAANLQNTQGQILSQSALTLLTQALTNTGDIAANSLALNGGVVNNQGTIDAATLTTQLDSLINSGDIAAVNTQIHASQIDNAGLLVATGNNGQSFTISADNLTNTGTLASYGENFTLSNLALNNSNGAIVHFGTGVLTLDTLSALNNTAGLLRSASNITINQSDIDNQAGLIEAANTLTINVDNVANQGGELRANRLDLDARNLNNQNGLIAIAEQLDIDVQQTLNNHSGKLLSTATQARVATQDLVNQSGLISQLNNSALHVEVSGELSGADSVIRADDILNINAGQLNNQGTLAANALTINATSLNNQATIQANNLNIDTQALQNGGLLLAAGTQGESLNVSVAGTLFNNGQIQARGENVTISGLVDNSNGQIIHAGLGVLQLDELINANGVVHAENQLRLVGSQINNNAGVLQANQAVVLGDDVLPNQTLLNQSGTIQANNITINSHNVNNNAGQISADNQLTARVNQYQSSGGVLFAGNQLDLQAAQVSNTSGALISASQTRITTPLLQNNGGKIESTQSMALDVASVQNRGGLILSAGNTFSLTPGTRLDNSAGGQVEVHSQDWILNSQNLNNQGGVLRHMGTGAFTVQNTGTLNNDQGYMGTLGALNLRSNTLSNQQGRVIAGSGLTADVNQTLNNSAGVILNAAGNLNIEATTLNNGAMGANIGSIVQNGSGVLTIAAENLNNQGRLQGQSLGLNATTLTNTGSIQGSQVNVNANLFDNDNGFIAATATGNESLRLVTNQAVSNQNGVIQSAATTLSLSQGINNRGGELVLLGNGSLNVTNLDNNNGQVVSQGSIQSSGTLSNQSGVLQATKTIQLQQTGINNQSGKISAGNNLLLSATSLNNQSGLISSGGNTFDINVNGALNNSEGGALVTRANTMQISASNLDNANGTVKHLGSGQLTLDGLTTLNNSNGVIDSAGNLSLTATELTNNSGVIVANQADINTGSMSNREGTVQASQLTISASSLDNTSGALLGLGSGSQLLNVNVNGKLENASGIIYGATGASLTTDELANTQGTIQSNGNLSINSLSVNNSHGQIAAQDLTLSSTGTITNNSGVLTGERVTLSGAELNNSNGEIVASGTGNNSLSLAGLDSVNNNSGVISSAAANQNVSLNNFSNANGKLLHQGTGTFTVSQTGILTNDGLIASGGNLTLSANGVDNQGNLQASNTLQIGGGLTNQTSGVLLAENIDINASGKTVLNSGKIEANKDGSGAVSINALNINNIGSLYSADSLTLEASNISNTGSISTEAINANGFSALTNSGRIESLTANYSGGTLTNQANGVLVGVATGNSALNLNVNQLINQGEIFNNGTNMAFGGSISNAGSIVHRGNGVLTLGNNGNIDVEGGSIATAGTARLMSSVSGAGDIYAQTGMEITSATPFVNSHSSLYTEGNLQINAEVNNQSGSLIADGTLGITTTGAITNSSGVIQGHNLNLQAGTLANDNGTITSIGSGAASIRAGSINNAGGLIQSTGSGLSVSATQGAINNAGGNIVHRGSGVLAVKAATHLDNSSGRVLLISIPDSY